MSKVSLGGGLPVTFFSGPQLSDSPIAVDATNAYYWRDDGALMKVSLAGGTPTVLIANRQFFGIMASMIADGPYLYWIDAYYAGAAPSLRRVSISDGSAVTLAYGRGLARIAVDATHVYATDFPAGTILKVPK